MDLSVLFGYDTPAMLSRTQEVRVREVLGSHPRAKVQTYCLEHLAAAAKIPSRHLADLAASVQVMRGWGACETQVGGICDAKGHDTDALLVWRPPTRPVAQGLTS